MEYLKLGTDVNVWPVLLAALPHVTRPDPFLSSVVIPGDLIHVAHSPMRTRKQLYLSPHL